MVTAATKKTDAVTDVSPDLLASWLREGKAVLVDVREDYEHAEERIEGAVLASLSRFAPERIRQEHGGKRIVFHCRSGKRSADAANRFRANGEAVFHLVGGIENWKAVGMPVIKPVGAPRLPVMRQVLLAAGFLVVLGVGLSLFLENPWYLALSAFVGCGLMFAGATGWCGMAMLLGMMPWNRRPASSLNSSGCCSA